MKRLLIAGLVLVFLVFGLWIVAVPASLITNLVEGAMREGDLRLRVTELQKGLFYDFTCGSITLLKKDKPLLSVENIEGKINPLSLLLLKLDVSFDGDLSGGKVDGSIDLFRGGDRVSVAVRNAGLEGMPFFSQLGIRGNGVLSGDISIKNAKGTATFSVADARFDQASIAGIAVPLNVFTSALGAMTVGSKTLRIQSFALEGEGIYARLSGDISAGRMNLKMELMPEKNFKDQNVVFIMIKKYEVSPGYYSIPLTGPLPL